MNCNVSDTIKIIFIFPVVFLLGIASFAQPVLIASTNSPTGTDAFARYTCGVSHFTTGTGGAAITWDFSGLTSISIDTITYESCPASGLCDSFSGSNLAAIGGGSHQFFSPDTTKFALLGTDPGGGNVYYSRPRALIPYPLSYGAVQNVNYAFSRPAFSSYGFGTDSFTADGYGTLILPSGTYSNVLRIHAVSINIDSNISGSAAAVDTFRTDVYYWYAPGFHNPLLAMYYDFSTLSGVPELAQVDYYSQVPDRAGIASVNANEHQPKLLPNPAAGVLNINLFERANEPVTVDILDMSGRIVLPGKYKDLGRGNNNVTIQLPGLAPGIYMARIISPDKCTIANFVVQH